MQKVSFINKQTSFFTTIKEKVNTYFETNQIQKSGERKLYIKGVILISTALLLYTTLVFFNPGSLASIFLCILLGINIAVIGFNVMHEGGHQSLSKISWINTIAAYCLNILGGNIYYWKIKHNINHHTYTNIEGLDADIDLRPFMRLHSAQKHFWIHNFQHIYCVIFYGLSYLSWIFWDDFQKYFTGKIAEVSQKKLHIREHFIFWITKFIYLIVYLGIPIYMLGLVPAIIGFSIVCFVCGIFIAIVFQLAHVVEGTYFHEISSDDQKIENEWAIHQICTTANFSTNSKVISWFLGGLNFQVEHHLFPRISHIHYPKINDIVKETCNLYEIKYLEYSTIFTAIGSHFNHLKKMGRSVIKAESGN